MGKKMKKDKKIKISFDELKRVDDQGVERWSAMDLMLPPGTLNGRIFQRQ
jgi:hypothetical protein